MTAPPPIRVAIVDPGAGTPFHDHQLCRVLAAAGCRVVLAFALELELIAPEKAVLSLSGEPRKPESETRLQALLTAGAVRASARHTEIYKLLAEGGQATGPGGSLWSPWRPMASATRATTSWSPSIRSGGVS